MKILDYLFESRRKKEVLNVLDVKTIDPNDGDSIHISSNNGYMNNVEFSQFERDVSEVQRIQTYRQISKSAEIDEVMGDIVNETFIFQSGRKSFELDWFPNNEDLSDQLKDRIYNEFCNVYEAFNFDDIGSELLSNFYVDGRMAYQKVVDKNNPKKGIKQVIWLDPINVVKVKFVPQRNMDSKMIDINSVDDFYVYTNKRITKSNTNVNLNHMYTDPNDIIDGIRLELDEITYITSGLTNINNQTIGHLDKAIIPYNNLKMMEQSMVIFRVVRAPMRRAFYVDVSGMPKMRADELMRNMSNQFRSKVMYNADTGSWVDRQSIISMVEDYFIPRHNDGKTTEIQNIEGQSSQEILDEVNFMQDKLYQALNAPKSRYREDNNIFLFGKSDQIPRDEYRYKKFIDRLRNRFMLAVDDVLKTQLILKGIITEKDWHIVKRAYFWNYTEDNAFIEYKDAEIMNSRLAVVSSINDLIDRGYYSNLWVRKNILKQTDEEIEEIDKQVYKERMDQESDLPNGNTSSNDEYDNGEYKDDEPDDKQNDDSNSNEEDDELDYGEENTNDNK